MVKLGELIELQSLRLVIELDDAERDPEGILNSFVLTEEVERGLRAILEAIASGKGAGAFIKGNFGSGKSHFLSFLYLLLKDKKAPIIKDYKTIGPMSFTLVKLSLVRYPSSMSLEEILISSLNYHDKVTDREEVFKRLFNGPSVIIIDELSEFLRSKPSPAQFYEDIRFLQFLGEFSMRHPLWVIASLQEWIEETGHISSSIFNRIKDRYPLRINLSSSHIEDIIDQRLVRKKEGSEEPIRAIFNELKRFYPHLDLSYERFRKTYPLHPFTTRYLSGLTRLFSQHRGVIQFVQSEVGKRLDDPADSLITPEVIFDHFEDRLREIPEISSFSRIAYDYYRNNLSSIFTNQRQREVAEAAIKILILTELSPLEKRKTAKEIAEILLKKISTIKESINYDYLRNVLESLVSHQMYIMRDGEVYFIDISQDEGIRIKARIKAIRERFSDRNYLLSEVANLLSLPYLPLRDIKDGKRYRFSWQNSMRECIVLLSSGIGRDDIERFIDGIKKRVDGYLVLLSPFQLEAAHASMIQPSVFDLKPLSLISLWQPRGLTEEELVFVEEYIAKTMLLNDFPSIKEGMKNEEPKFRDIITRAYFEGKVFSADGRESINIKDMGYLPIERLLSHLFDEPLRTLYPEHQRIMPKIDIFSAHHISNLFSHFIKQGKLTIEEAEKKGLVPYIKGILEPLGLVLKRGSAFTLHIAVEDEVISYVLNLIDQEHDLYNIKQNLRKSQWGMSDSQIDLLLSSLIVSGYLIPYGRHEAVEFKDLSQLSSGDIVKLKPGKALEPELLAVIPRGRFIWGEFQTPTPATIKTMWKEASQFIRRYRKVLDELQSMINRYRDYSIFRLMRIDAPLLNRLNLFLQSVSLNLSPQEGIERFLLFLKENEDMESQVSYVERLYKFFNEEFQLINKYYLYLNHPALQSSLKPEAEGEPSFAPALYSLMKGIQEFLEKLGDLEEIRKGWTEFHDSYCSLYKDSHERFYDAPVFSLKRQIEDLPALKALKRVSHIVRSITFEKEWWEIKKRIDELPERCNLELNQELFLAPICRCGFQIGMEPPSIDTDLKAECEDGIRNFLRTIQSPDNREKIDSLITGLSLSGKKELSERLIKLLSIKPEKTATATILPFFENDLLEEIENAFKGRWKVKELTIEDLIEKIRGRRFRHEELKRLILNWIGNDTDSIIHVRSKAGEELIGEELAIYGIEGKKAQMELIEQGTIDEHGLQRVFDSINLRRFDTPELIGLLKKERNDYMKKRLRDELSGRLLNGEGIELERLDIEDPVAEISRAISLIKKAETFKGIEVFTGVVAPLFILIERLLYENINDRFLDHELLKRLYSSFEGILKEYEKGTDRFNGVRDLYYVKERLSGNVIIMDCLRYDLWVLLRKIMLNEGWKVRDEVFRIDIPSTTVSFREAMGISDEGGTIDGRTYSLLRIAEKDIGKRNLRKFLKEAGEIRFLHFNFIDARVHASTLDIHPLYEIIKREFITGIIPVLKEVGSFYLLSDHGFVDTKEPKERYRHGGRSLWETLLPFAEVRL